MNTFSFRSECRADVERFEAECGAFGTMLVRVKPDAQFPDCEVEFDVFDNAISLETLRDAMSRVQDGHVMLQTLRQCPLAENSLERDYELV